MGMLLPLPTSSASFTPLLAPDLFSSVFPFPEGVNKLLRLLFFLTLVGVELGVGSSPLFSLFSPLFGMRNLEFPSEPEPLPELFIVFLSDLSVFSMLAPVMAWMTPPRPPWILSDATPWTLTLKSSTATGFIMTLVVDWECLVASWNLSIINFSRSQQVANLTVKSLIRKITHGWPSQFSLDVSRNDYLEPLPHQLPGVTSEQWSWLGGGHWPAKQSSARHKQSDGMS